MYRKKEVGHDPNLETRKRVPLYTCITLFSFCCTNSECSRNHKIKWHFFIGLLLLRNGKTWIKFRSNFLQTFLHSVIINMFVCHFLYLSRLMYNTRPDQWTAGRIWYARVVQYVFGADSYKQCRRSAMVRKYCSQVRIFNSCKASYVSTSFFLNSFKENVLSSTRKENNNCQKLFW